jgi:hypothetical protein
MTPAEATNTIEGQRFAALTNLASNLKTFLRIAAQQPEVETLARAMTNEPALIAAVEQRALALAADRAGGECESEGDAVLATYLWLLSKHRRELAQAAAGSLGERRQFFWARKVADELHLAEGSADGNGSEATAERTAEAKEGVGALGRNP